jgi:hypothetical protein
MGVFPKIHPGNAMALTGSAVAQRTTGLFPRIFHCSAHPTAWRSDLVSFALWGCLRRQKFFGGLIFPDGVFVALLRRALPPHWCWSSHFLFESSSGLKRIST